MFMGRGQRKPDTIAIELDHVTDVLVRKKKFELLREIRSSFYFEELIRLAQGVDIATNDRLAHAIMDAKWQNMPVGPIIERYAQKYIYPHRKKN